MESIKQKQLASDIQRIMSQLLQQDFRDLLNGAFVTVSDVSMTPDLLIARIYISVLQEDQANKVLENLNENKSRIRGALGNQLRHKVRRIPEVTFYIDKSLDEVFQIERLLKEGEVNRESEE